MKEEAGAGWGLIQGKRVASEPLENRRQNRWKTAGGHWQNRWKNRRWKTAGKTAGKPLENRWKTTGKTAGRPPGNRWKAGVEPLEKPLENRRGTTGKNCWKTAENRRGKPRFWVTFASLNKEREGPERASPTSFFGPWGGLP